MVDGKRPDGHFQFEDGQDAPEHARPWSVGDSAAVGARSDMRAVVIREIHFGYLEEGVARCQRSRAEFNLVFLPSDNDPIALFRAPFFQKPQRKGRKYPKKRFYRPSRSQTTLVGAARFKV